MCPFHFFFFLAVLREFTPLLEKSVQFRPGVQSNTWRSNTERKSKERDWCELAFVDFPKMEAEREKNMCAYTVILTPLCLPDLRVMEVSSVILMNKSHTDSLLVKMREEKCILLLLTFQKKECVGNRERQR